MDAKGSKNILIAGGSGLIGSALSDYLSEKGYNVSILSRKTNSKIFKTYIWNPYQNEIDPKAITDNQYIINLAGAGIADKLWSKKRKQELIDSRVKSTKLLVNAVLEHNPQIEKFISTSAIGFYGNRPEEIVDEKSTVGNGFLAKLCNEWENETQPLLQNNVPTNILRIGIVLSGKKGFIGKLLPQFKMGLNVVFGNGNQKASWIHIKDLVNMFQYCLENETPGTVYNAVSPEVVSSYELQKSIARSYSKKTIDICIPERLIKILFGDFSEVFLNDQAIKPERFMTSDFQYQFNEIDIALKSFTKKNASD